MSGLNSEQEKVVNTTEGALAVRAGAGAGKTRVLTYRAKEILNRGDGLLFVTFTRKASEEMRQRLKDMLGIIQQDQAAGISTLHSFMLNWVIQPFKDDDAIEAIRRKKGLRTIDTAQRYRFIKQAMNGIPVEQATFMEQGRLKDRDLLTCMTFTNAKALDPYVLTQEQAYQAAIEAKYSKENSMILGETLPIFARAIEEQSMDQNVIDFDAMLVSGITLLKYDDNYLAFLRERFPYIQIDEFQDTNYAQLEILRILASEDGNICAVGDDRQAIYGFRGACQGIFGQFAQTFNDCQMLELRMNYRSSPNIVKTANCCAKAMPIAEGLEATGDMIAGQRMRQPEPCDFWWFNTDKQEAEAIADYLTTTGAGQHTLVLYRNRLLKSETEQALMAAGVDYDILEEKSFFEYLEVQWGLYLVKALANPEDMDSWMETFGNVKLNMSEKRGRELWLEGGLDEIHRAAANSKKGEGMVKFLDDCQILTLEIQAVEEGDTADLSAPDKLKEALLHIWSQWLQPRMYNKVLLRYKRNSKEVAEQKATGVMESINKRIDILFDIIQRVWYKKHNLQLVLEQIENYGPRDKDNDESDEGQVVLSTTHSAKGLEAHTVIVIGGGDIDKALETLDSEERRIFYVALTRAEKKLIVTGCGIRSSLGVRRAERIPSPYIEELGESITSIDFTEEESAPAFA